MVSGRLPIYDNVEDLKYEIDRYFGSISITEAAFSMELDYTDDKGKSHFKKIPILNNNGEQYVRVKWLETPTVCGLAEYIGMTRQTLNEYGKMDIFSDTIKEAKGRVERYLEEGLDGKDVTGRIFNLKNNFGWVDRQETEHSGTIAMPTIQITK